MQYRREKKEKLTELALLYGKTKWRLLNTATTPCDGLAAVFAFDDVMEQIAVPFAVCIFGGFGEIALAAVTTKNTRMSNRSANAWRELFLCFIRLFGQRGKTLHHLFVTAGGWLCLFFYLLRLTYYLILISITVTDSAFASKHKNLVYLKERELVNK